MKRRRVKITGIGPVTPAGIGREAFWKGILEPVSRVRAFGKLGDEHGPFVAASIDGFQPGDYIDRKLLPKGSARHTQFAAVASALAVKDAGIALHELRASRCAIVVGACLMDFGAILASVDAVHKKGSVQGRGIHTTGVGSVPSAVGAVLELDSRTVAFSNQCASAFDAIIYAATMIAEGEIDVALCGGSDAPLHRSPLLEMRAGRLISANEDMPERQVRPFDLWRNVSAIAEGCAMLVLESEQSERAGYAWLSGYGFANDRSTDLCSGLAEATRLSLASARVRSSDIEVINAWAPGDRRVDAAEASAMKAVFGPHLANIAVTSIKGALGSPLGAAPAIQVAAAAMAQRTGMVPPTVNWDFPDPECPLNLSNRARCLPHARTVVNVHGLSGVNGSLVIERC